MSRNKILIIILSILAVIIVIANISLYLNYQAKTKGQKPQIITPEAAQTLPKDPLTLKIDNIISNYIGNLSSNIPADSKKAHDDLLALNKNIIDGLDKLTNSSDSGERYDAYFGLTLFWKALK